MKLKALFFIAFLGFLFNGFGQSYSNDREKFVKEFKKVLSDYGKGEFHDFAKKELHQIFFSSIGGSSFKIQIKNNHT